MPDAARWLGLAAAPTFASMALWTAAFGDRSGGLCGAMQGASPFGGMTAMYLLMSLFHLAPWLRLAARQGRSDRAEAPSPSRRRGATPPTSAGTSPGR